MSVALVSPSAPTSTRQEPLRVMVVDDSVVIRGLISRWIGAEPDMVVAASLRTGLDAVNQTRTHQSRRRRARHRNAGARRHLGAAAAAGEEAQPHHHHGLDADPPQRGDQLQGAVARRLRLHSKAREHARGVRRRNLSPRPDPENSLVRRQASPCGPHGAVAAPGAGAGSVASRHRPGLSPRRLRRCSWCAAHSACRRRACF